MLQLPSLHSFAEFAPTPLALFLSRLNHNQTLALPPEFLIEHPTRSSVLRRPPPRAPLHRSPPGAPYAGLLPTPLYVALLTTPPVPASYPRPPAPASSPLPSRVGRTSTIQSFNQ